jgi:hypothetical protein
MLRALRLKIALAALLVCAVAGAATVSAAKPKPQPVFRVSVKSTYVNHSVITVLGGMNRSNGCRQRYDVDATQKIDVSTTRPVVRTLAQLRRGSFVSMQAHEQRNGTGRNGWEPGCAALANDPAQFDDTSACGPKAYAVSNTSLGYLAATGTRFALTYSRNGADPYAGNCFAVLYTDPYAGDAISVVDFPADPWGTANGTKAFWADLNRARLTSGKTIVLSWHGTATVSVPYLEPDPSLQTNVTSNEYTLSWDVTIVPVKPAKK